MMNYGASSEPKNFDKKNRKVFVRYMETIQLHDFPDSCTSFLNTLL